MSLPGGTLSSVRIAAGTVASRSHRFPVLADRASAHAVKMRGDKVSVYYGQKQALFEFLEQHLAGERRGRLLLRTGPLARSRDAVAKQGLERESRR